LKGISFTVYLFELRDPDDSKMVSSPKISKDPNVKFNVIPIGISGKSEIIDFYINKFELSSSLLRPSSLSKGCNPGFSRWGGIYEKMLSWSENTELSEVKKVKTATIDEILNNAVALPPDILSMDIQGVEVEALHGAKNVLANHVIAVTSESEFFEIYAGQGLFKDQLQILQDNSFRFVKFFGFQKWFPGPMVGHGFVTVTESLFIKYLVNPDQLQDTEVLFTQFKDFSSKQIFKAALVSFAYERYSYFYTCMKYLEDKDKVLFESVKSNKNLLPYVDYYEYIKENIDHLRTNPNFFIQNPHRINSKTKRFLAKLLLLSTYKLIKILKLRGLIFKTESHLGIYGDMH
jgi:FkbM family methyltransferase